MSSNETSRALDPLDTAKRDEEHMRNVLLGLGGGGGGRSGRAQRSTPQAHAPAGRHKFAQDGDVPVVRLSLARTETREAKRPMPAPEPVTVEPVDREKAARHAAERSLTDITTTLHGVQTRLGHAELDLERAQALLQAREQELAALRAELRAREQELAVVRRGDGTRRRVPEARVPEAGAGQDGAERAVGRPLTAVEAAEALFAPVAPALMAGSAQGSEGTPEPVKWWHD